MKKVLSISLGDKRNDYCFRTQFLGQNFEIKRVGTNGDLDRVAELLLENDGNVDIFGLGCFKFPPTVGPDHKKSGMDRQLIELSKRVKTPITNGYALRKVAYEWAIRHLQFKFGGNYFNNTKALFLSGMTQYTYAKVMAEYTDNIRFADPVIEHGVPKFLNSLKELELYANGVHDILSYVPSKTFTSALLPTKMWNEHILRKAVQKAHTVLVTHRDFETLLNNMTSIELKGKTIISSTVYESRVKFLENRGVDVIVDCTPQILERVVGIDVLEALIISALGKTRESISADDLLEVIAEQRMDPRVLYPKGSPKRVNRFAFVIHPLSQEQLKMQKAIKTASDLAPPFFMEVLEKTVAYAPPMIYSKVTGIKSPTGVETEGWLISLAGTPRQMLSHSPEFTYKRLLQAAKMAKSMGAQIIGLGAFTKVVGDAGETVSKLAPIPVTTGNSYSASGALWAAADASRKLGLLAKPKPGEKIQGKAMVIGATGAIGSVCCRLLAKAFNEVYLVDIRDARLLALRESILNETPDVELHISTRADKFLPDMDVIVTATSAAGKKILDIRKVKPGCVITDVARPLDLSPEDVALRPDVLVVESGEIELPGEPEMRDIGLPDKVVYACLAETIVLALEGRFEPFTIGRDIEWEKVREIYKMGLKHGMKLAAISGVNGVFSDEDIARVRKLAIEARKKMAKEGHKN
ncbi:MAG: dehydrogenase [Acidobacteria bacterium]|nr:MAG: dehydrogenase [Acidobacteriota bacterium]